MSTFLLNPVLIIESSLDSRISLCQYIESTGAQTIHTDNGKDAIELWCKYHNSIIFIDFELSDMHGLDVVEFIKSRDSDTYIIAATALNNPDIFKKSIALGVDGWLTKPFDMSVLYSTMLKAKQICEYRRSERLMRASFDAAASGNIILNSSGLIEHANLSFLNMLGLSEAEVIGKDPSLFMLPVMSLDSATDITEAIITIGESYSKTVLVFTGPSDPLTLCKPVSIVDVTALKMRELEIRRLATTDALTGLPNRTVIEDRIHQAVLKSKRNKNTLAIMFVDLDKFKNVNDVYGHGVGDLLLIEFSQRVSNLLRSSDTVSRFGGDEFIVLLPEVSSVAGAIYTANKILDVSKIPFYIENITINISCSIGISIYPDLVNDEDTLLRKSDEAMYQAKNRGRGQISIINNFISDS